MGWWRLLQVGPQSRIISRNVNALTCRTVYFFMQKSPLQFKVCAIFQLSIDFSAPFWIVQPWLLCKLTSYSDRVPENVVRDCSSSRRFNPARRRIGRSVGLGRRLREIASIRTPILLDSIAKYQVALLRTRCREVTTRHDWVTY